MRKQSYGEFCSIINPHSCGIVLFGASGDLAYKKLYPSIFKLYIKGFLKEKFYVLGFARTKFTKLEFEKLIKKSIQSESDDQDIINKFIMHCDYISGGYSDSESYFNLKNKIEIFNKKFQTAKNIIFSLATPPILYSEIVKMLGEGGIVQKGNNDDFFQRIIIEKPFGIDLKSSKKLDQDLFKYLDESQIYRIDHYMGKDTVQNIFILRFANSIFENIWNRDCIDHVAITVAEDIGIGKRAGYYDSIGQIKDMLQNHILQLVSFIAMEPPIEFTSEFVKYEKLKVLSSIKPYNLENLEDQIILGQYSKSKTQNGYTEEENVDANSLTETFFVTKLLIDNWRWEGVPFFIRSGKCMENKISKISIVFKNIPKSIFSIYGITKKFNNILNFNIFPEQGITLNIQSKIPDSKMCIGSMNMDFNFFKTFGKTMSSDYNLLILDCILGDQTLFWGSTEVTKSWELITPLLEKLKNSDIRKKILYKYEAGTNGPQIANEFIKKHNTCWT